MAKPRPEQHPMSSSDAAETSRKVSRRAALGIGVGVLGLGVAAVGSAPRAWAVDEYGFPTWEEVEAARANEATKAGEVSRINSLIADLEARVAETQALARRAGDEFYVAQQAFHQQQRIASDLEAAAAQQAEAADLASQRAAQAANRLVREGGDSKALDMFFNPSENPTDALTDLGRVERLVQQNQALYDDAVAARNTATQLSAQAQVAATERDRLQQLAEAAWLRAQAVAEQARNELFEQQLHLDRLRAQLAALQDTTATTVAEYEAGVEYRAELERQRLAREAEERRIAAERAAEAQRLWEAEQERIRIAEAEAERIRQQQAEEERQRQDDWAVNNPAPAPPPTNTGGGTTGTGGWRHPMPTGWVTSSYGARASFWTEGGWTNSYHYGTDFSGSPACGVPLRAANSGTVVFAGWSGGYGNHVVINHHNGWATSYSHIVDGGYNVYQGQWVESGAVVAYSGTTGRSTGCHLHFEVYEGGPNGPTVNPATFLSNRGVSP